MALITDLIGKTLVSIDQIENEELIFTTSEGERYRMYHQQDCCESVEIEDITGDLSDLLNSPIIKAEERTSEEDPEEWVSVTYTFYSIATIKGYVDIRWYGKSNGYYSESVDFEKIQQTNYPL